MKIFIISDHHFGHKNIIKLCNRPFSNVEEMDEVMMENWNSVVSENDLVYHLGDVFWSQRSAYTIMPKLKGKKIFLIGNHDKELKRIAQYYPENQYVEGFLEIKEPVKAVLCHYPFLSWNGVSHGVYHFSGHTHNNMEGQSDRHRINVCVEQPYINYTPQLIIELVEKQNKLIENIIYKKED